MYEYDNLGRLKFHPDLHFNQGKSWTTVDQKYLIDNYTKTSPEDCSFALGRTIATIMQKACELRQKGLMPPKPEKLTRKRRMKQ